MTVDEHGRRYPEVWHRFSPRETLVRYAWYLGIIFVAAASLGSLDITWVYLLDAHVQAADLLIRMYPPHWSYLDVVMGALVETVHIATLGTLATIVNFRGDASDQEEFLWNIKRAVLGEMGLRK
jgi:phosphonate transport system permease protein